MGPTALDPVQIASLVGGAVTFLLAIGAVGHTLVTKRDPRSATIWLLAILLLPLVGVALYVLFGINRYRRRAIRMREDHPRLAPAPSPDTATASATRNATRSQPNPGHAIPARDAARRLRPAVRADPLGSVDV